MATAIGALRAEMSAGHAQFESDMGKARDAVRKNAKQMETAMNGVRGSFTSTIKSIAAFSAAAGLAAGAAGVALMKQAINTADKMTKLAQSVGISVEALTALDYAAKFSGVATQGLANGLKKLSKNAADAAAGTGEARGAFKALGISVKDLDGRLKSSEELLVEVAGKFEKMEDGAGKTALAMRLFGKAGADLIPMLNLGSERIGELKDEAKALGLVIDTEVGQAAERFNDNLGRLAGLGKGFFNQLMKELIPSLEKFTDKMVDAAKETDSLEKSATAAATGLRLFLTPIAIITGVFKTLGEYIGGVAAALVSFATGNFRRAAAILADTGWTLIGNLEDTVGAVRAIWDDTANEIEEKAPATAKKIAAPIIETGEIIKGVISKDLLADWDIFNDYAKRSSKIFNEVKTPVERFNETMSELRVLLQLGYIDFETFQRAGRKAAADWKGAGEDISNEFDELRQAIDGWGKDAAGTFADFAMSGKASFRDLIDSIIRDMIKMAAYKAIFKPLFSGFGSLLPVAQGNVFSHGKVIPFSRGGIVRSPAIFPMASGMGLMGEAGPEAILPLTRTSGGDLGVKAEGGGREAGDTHIFITAIDAKSFEDMCRRNPGAITSQVMQSLRDNKTRSEMRALVR